MNNFLELIKQKLTPEQIDELLADCEKSYFNEDYWKKLGKTMTTADAIEILRKHNEWRRGAEIPMEEPKVIGEAIDVVIQNALPTANDMKLVVEAEGSIYDECGSPKAVLAKYPTEDAFYGEVLRRFNQLKEK